MSTLGSCSFNGQIHDVSGLDPMMTTHMKGIHAALDSFGRQRLSRKNNAAARPKQSASATVGAI
jgi:hypothetical protein